jgi:hypothetical protein
VQTRPPFFARRGGVDDIVVRATCDEKGRNPLLGLVRVDQSPHEGLEQHRLEGRGLLKNAFTHEEEAPLPAVPDDWLPFSEASTQGVVDPDTLSL